MKYLKISNLFLCVAFSPALASGEAFTFDKSITPGNPEWELLTSTDRKAGYYPIAAVKSTQEDIVFIFDGGIGMTNYKKGLQIAGWPLSRWPTESDASNKKIYDLDLGSGITQAKPWDKPHHQGEQTTLGCLGANPLRYGDIDGDGKQELVAYLQDGNLQQDWIVFSPEKKTVTFSVRLALQDYLPSDEPDPKLNGGFQYISDENQRYMHPGIRIYAKIFIDEFNGNANKDILVWRKRYITLKKDNPKKGFQLETEVINHYELINGAYIKQATDMATLKTWLAAKQLTWQKGYPSKSECKGQEGKLIPEMHDLLLNDPDVLN